MKKYIIILLAFGLCSCSYRRIKIPYKVGTTNAVATYTSTRLGNNEALKEVRFEGPNGEVFIIQGWSGNQTEGMGIIAEASARGAVQGLTGQYKLAPKNDVSLPQPELK